MITDIFVKIFVAFWNILLLIALIVIIAGGVTMLREPNADLLEISLAMFAGMAGLGMMSMGVSAWQKLDQIATNTKPPEA